MPPYMNPSFPSDRLNGYEKLALYVLGGAIKTFSLIISFSKGWNGEGRVFTTNEVRNERGACGSARIFLLCEICPEFSG